MRAGAAAGAALAVALAGQIGAAATWLPPVRRSLAPGLQAPGDPGTVALTFDDGPHPQGTPAVLDALAAGGATATFFLLGSQVRAYPGLAAEIARRGHEVALHGDEHRYLIARPPWAVTADLARGRAAVEGDAGVRVTWWRPPYGVLSGPALLAARRLGLRPVLWSAWGRDWRAAVTPGGVVADLLAPDPAGGTLLLHDSDVTSSPGSWRTTVAAVPLLLEALARRGLRTVTLAERRPDNASPRV